MQSAKSTIAQSNGTNRDYVSRVNRTGNSQATLIDGYIPEIPPTLPGPSDACLLGPTQAALGALRARARQRRTSSTNMLLEQDTLYKVPRAARKTCPIPLHYRADH